MVTDLWPTGNQNPFQLLENLNQQRHIGPLSAYVSRNHGQVSIGVWVRTATKGGPDWSVKRDMLSPRDATTGTNCRSPRPDGPH